VDPNTSSGESDRYDSIGYDLNMFTMDDQHVQIRLHRFLSAKGSNTVPSVRDPGQAIPLADVSDIMAVAHDESILKEVFRGKLTTEAGELFESVRPQLQCKELVNATSEEVEQYFS
jgi:hypothetical protein